MNGPGVFKQGVLRRAALCVTVFLLGLVMVSSVSAQTLSDAYQVELSRLQAEQESMRSALEASKVQGDRTRGALVSEIEMLSRTLTKLRTENNSQELQLPQTARLQTLQAQERNVDRRARQIETWLETHGVTLPKFGTISMGKDEAHAHPPLDLMMKAALQHVEEHGQLWIQIDQEYFDDEGVATKGSVLRIAEVGAVAVKPDFRPLALALDGSLRVTNPAGTSVVYGDKRTINVTLFDPKDVRPASVDVVTWRDWMNRGGVVMWVIGALAVLAVLVFLERLFAHLRFVLRLSNAERRGPEIAVGRDDPLLAAVDVVQNGQDALHVLESKAAEALIQTQPYVRRSISLLAVVASVAPLLGLLGTVTGMIGTFGMITEHGTGDPRLLSGGISEALLTTQFGLMVAIPALLFQTTLYRSGDAILRRVERFALSALSIKENDRQSVTTVTDQVSPVVRSAL